ncbi:MAG: glycerophosphodiester phosphodiesterase [Candidatus Promineifilaceae bacterium]
MSRLPDQPFAKQGGPLVFAHRGWRGKYPENTLLAFEKAAQLGVDALEMDIHATSDGVLVVHHDDTVDRMTDGQGPIKEYSWAALQALEVGHHWTADGGKTYPFRGMGLRIPALEDVFRRFGEWWINIDIKQREPNIVRPFIEMIRDYKMSSRMMVGSFHKENVAEFRQLVPEIATAADSAEVRKLLVLSKLGLGRFYTANAKALQIPETYRGVQIITPRFVRDAHRRDVAVHVWTVNETADMSRLLSVGVDGIMTDHPDRLLGLLGRLKKEG